MLWTTYEIEKSYELKLRELECEWKLRHSGECLSKRVLRKIAKKDARLINKDENNR